MFEFRKQKPSYESRITRKILLQYILTLVAFVVGYILFLILGYSATQLVIWQPNNPVYIVLHFVKEYLPVFIIPPLIAGWAFITYRFIGRPLRYLDEVIAGAKQLSEPTQKPILLSAAMKEAQDELNLARESALRNAQLLKEAEQRKNDLIVYLAHDLKTPLTSVIGYLNLLRDESQISEALREKYLSISLEKAERLEDLINEFFEITRFNLSHITLEHSRINMSRLLEQLVFEFQPMLAEKNLECKTDIAPNVTLRCDADKIQRVFDNLLRNAVNYSFENTSILITAKPIVNGFLKICFENHGNTIPPEKLARIFEQFYRLDTARSSKSGGAGLGLAIAKEITELHGGTISAQSENETVSFTVTLPLS